MKSLQKFDFPGIGETMYSTVLENGLEIRVIPKKGFSSSYAVFATNYGGAHRRFTLEGVPKDTPAGVAHFLEHKMFDLPNGDNALSILSANGADPNAFTSSGMTCYYFECTEGFEENLRMLLHFVSTPYFTEETVAKEQGIIGQEIRMGEDNPGIELYYNLLKLMYKNHPLRDRVAGTVESIAEITDDTLYDCHKVFYAPSNMVLCVEGDVDPETVERIACEELPTEHRPVPVADFGTEPDGAPEQKLSRVSMEVSAPQFLIGAKLTPAARGEAALRQRLVSMLALRLLCSTSSPFYTRLYEKGLLNMDFDYEADFTAGTACVIIGGESPDPDHVFEEFKAELASVCEHGFAEGSFKRAYRASIGARLRGLEDFDNVCISLVSGVFDGYCALDSFGIMQSITEEECLAFLRNELRPEMLVMSVVEPEAGTEEQDDE